MQKAIYKTAITISFLCFFSFICYSQKVGINTKTPQSTLDVVGDLRIRKSLKISDASGTNIDWGLKGDALVSRGSGLSPEWKLVGGSRTTYRIRESVVLMDTIGVAFNNNTNLNITKEYTENSDLTSEWKEIAGLKSYITPTSVKNRVLITVETVAHTNSMQYVDIAFSIGIFIDGKLKSIRPIKIDGDGLSFSQGVLYDSFENLELKSGNGSYTIQVAVVQRYRKAVGGGSSLYSTVGTGSGGSNASDWMNKTSLKVELYEAFLD